MQQSVLDERGADIRYLSEVSADGLPGESQRSFCQCHLPSRGMKEVGASVLLPPSRAALSLHNKVAVHEEGAALHTQGVLCQTQDNLKPLNSQRGDRRTQLPFLSAAHSCSSSRTNPLFLRLCLLCSLSLSFLIRLRLCAPSLWHAFLSTVA